MNPLILVASLFMAPLFPNPILTPGAVATTDIHEVCGRVAGLTYSRRHRVWHNKAETLAKYGLLPSAAHAVEDDDRVPVCLGGNNASPLNHWPEPWGDARKKDHFEDWSCRAVCTGHIPLATAQGWFLGDWRPEEARRAPKGN